MASQSNLPLGFNYKANEFLLQQNWLRIDYAVDEKSASPSFGFRSDWILPGSDYLFTLPRGIFNQHVLLEIGAFAGMAGGVIGLVVNRPGYPTAAFFAVSVMVGTYHIFSEWLSLIVKTRSSQAVKHLLDLRPETARVLRGTQELEVPIEDVKAGDLVRVRPGERIPADGTVVSASRNGAESWTATPRTGEALAPPRRPRAGERSSGTRLTYCDFTPGSTGLMQPVQGCVAPSRSEDVPAGCVAPSRSEDVPAGARTRF